MNLFALSFLSLQVIHESLRLANIAPVLFKRAREDVHIKGKKHLFSVIYNYIVLHHFLNS